jgi:ubiquitin-activating enzyme E1-like protein
MVIPYKPLYVQGMSTGLVQNRQQFILPNDAYPVLENAFVWREQLKRRQGLQLLGRLQRSFSAFNFFLSGASPWTFNILSVSGYVLTANNANPGKITTTYPHGLTTGDKVIITGIVGATGYNNVTFTITVVDALNFTIGVTAAGFGAYVSGGFWISNRSLSATEPNAQIRPGSVTLVIGTGGGAVTFTDQGDGTFLVTPPSLTITGTINYISGSVTITNAGAGLVTTLALSYFPMLPTMGIRTEELNQPPNNTIIFDTKYAYIYDTTQFIELPSTTPTVWTGTDANFFWSTNYWFDGSAIPNKLFWVTNYSGPTGDPIRYYNNITWTDFAPQINAAGNKLNQALALLPFRGTLMAFNTLEGMSLATSTYNYQRIRWSAIGKSPLLLTTSWLDDVRGQGGFLDIPTSENITAVGFVRDNLVIYCERSTWQLRYTGRAINPFQIERVNSELGSYSLFSAVQFDTSLVGIGDKGVVECDSYKSERIDIKIPDLVFNFSSDNSAQVRVQGIRDIQQRLAFWTYVFQGGTNDQNSQGSTSVYPNRRLVYNYENDSWAIFTDSLTALGNYITQANSSASPTWDEADWTWDEADYPWNATPDSFPSLLGGNQQGFIMFLSSNLQPQVSNDTTLSITNITGNNTTPTVVTSPNHNLVSNQVIGISGIPIGTPFANTLNNPLVGSITGATQSNPCQITNPLHGLSTGANITINNVGGMIQLNGNTYVITVIDANNFTLNDTDSTLFTAYTSGGDWTDLATNCFGIEVIDANNFQLWRYDPVSDSFDLIPQLDPSGQTYVGSGLISVRDGFTIQSKKFNFQEQGKNIQLGYLDLLMEATDNGEITLEAFINYNETNPVNRFPENTIIDTSGPDPFFNTVISTAESDLGGVVGSKYLQRVYCPVKGAFITLQFDLSNSQLISDAQKSEVQIDSQVLWMREAGRLQTY